MTTLYVYDYILTLPDEVSNGPSYDSTVALRCVICRFDTPGEDGNENGLRVGSISLFLGRSSIDTSSVFFLFLVVGCLFTQAACY
jgi:hypothetical protein